MLALFGLLSAMSGCGASAPSRAELVRSLKRSGMPAAEASCAAGAIFATLSDKQVAEIVQRGGSGAPYDDPKRTDDDMDKVRAALTKCRNKAQPEPTAEALTTTTSAVPATSPSSTSLTSSTTSTTLP